MAIKSIGIDIRDAHEKGAGKSRYTLEITRALLKIAPKNVVFFLFTNKPNPHFPSFKQLLVPGRGLFWHLNLKRYLLSRPVDLFLSPTSFIYPAIAPSSQKTALMVHDLIAFLYSKTHAWFPTLVERFMLPRALKKCRLIVCISEHTAKDLATLFPESQKKPVLIAPPAVSAGIQPTKSEKLDLPQHFLLGVGTLSPRKNFQALFAAFTLLAPKHKNLHIVIAGAKGWKTARIMRAIPTAFRSRVHFLGYVSESQLSELYSRAEMLVFPSVYEGFGIPLLEAMACNCPVVASNRTSIPEVVRDAALLVDPTNTPTFAAAIEFMLGPKAQAIYKKRGLKRAQAFSWEESARRILAQL
mgnify:CR=1 FL=1